MLKQGCAPGTPVHPHSHIKGSSHRPLQGDPLQTDRCVDLFGFTSLLARIKWSHMGFRGVGRIGNRVSVIWQGGVGCDGEEGCDF